MDILISSNLERLIYHIAGDDAAADAAYMKQLSGEGSYEITSQMKEKLADFYGGYADEEQTAQAIRSLYEETGYVIDPHTAVARYVYNSYVKETGDHTPSVIASTASPFKFEGAVMKALDQYEEIPDLDLADKLAKTAGVAVPEAVNSLRGAQIRHNIVCDKEQMETEVKKFLGL